MKCPVCPDSTLAMTNREGIEIDYCPTCRGVWLDRGELDKLIERSTAEMSSARSEPAPPPLRDPRESRDPRDYDRGRYDDDRYRDSDYHKRKRKSMWGELFDFD